MLQRLRETARRHFVQTGPFIPTGDEDLTLLGKGPSDIISSSIPSARDESSDQRPGDHIVRDEGIP